MSKDLKTLTEACALPASEIYRLSDDHWQAVSPTYIESWPEGLRRLSMESYGLRLTARDARVLSSYMGEFSEGFDVSGIKPEAREIARDTIVNLLDTSIQRVGGKAFVRLGSRSPKDCWLPREEGDIRKGLVRNGEQAFRRLTANSERLYEDLQTALAMGYEPWIWVRKWVEIAPWQEFRCFMRDREMVAISQYDYYQGKMDELAENIGPIEAAIKEFFQRSFLPAIHLDSVVFDVIAAPGEGGFTVSLVEINPYSMLTDPCLFSWSEIENLQELRVKISEETKKEKYTLDIDDPDGCFLLDMKEVIGWQ